MKMEISVVDLFCGAGGFSEGFRQAGCRIVMAVDRWEAARQTHKLNHPHCKHPGLDCFSETKGDILLIPTENINDIIADSTIIVGSPPCISFSSSNRAGKADKSSAIRLIEKFLQIVAVKKYSPNSKLKYWIMENVPNSRKHVKSNYTFESLGLNDRLLKKLKIKKKEQDIALVIDTSKDAIYNSVHYGVPQRRERFLCGEFPIPEKRTPERDSWVSLGKVISALKIGNKTVTDPNYGFEVDAAQITDHYYDTSIPPFEWEEARIKKEQARYYGKMSFPEDESKPSRTVMATRTVRSRESMILQNGSRGNYRSPTIREIASLMSFPITYLFQANNEASKYRLVGNAVCPKLSLAFAEAIAAAENVKKKYSPNPNSDHTQLTLNWRKSHPIPKKARDKHPLTDFAEIVPDLKLRNFRVELDNGFPRINRGKLKWSGSIHHATGKDCMKAARPNISEIIAMLSKHPNKKEIDDFIAEVNSAFFGNIPPARRFHEQHCLSKKDGRFLTPRQALRKIKGIVDSHFPESRYRDAMLSNIRGLGKRCVHFKFDNGSPPDEMIPLRIVAAMYGVAYVCWATKHEVGWQNGIR